MTHAQLKLIMDESRLSPEQLAAHFGVSNMTLRRWAKESGQKNLPAGSERNIVEGIYALISRGVIDPQSPNIQKILNESPSISFEAALSHLGITSLEVEQEASYKNKMTTALFQIGSNQEHRTQVNTSGNALQWFRKLGSDWKSNIDLLGKVLRHRNLTQIDKLVAYGALFYLISPIDLIPDSIPFAGVVDDYAFLVFAVTYYTSKFPEYCNLLAEPNSKVPSV